ncbi:MAG TPA: hypothetical protein VF733_04765 [Candidatus Saccharimonadales bacterium]
MSTEGYPSSPEQDLPQDLGLINGLGLSEIVELHESLKWRGGESFNIDSPWRDAIRNIRAAREKRLAEVVFDYPLETTPLEASEQIVPTTYLAQARQSNDKAGLTALSMPRYRFTKEKRYVDELAINYWTSLGSASPMLESTEYRVFFMRNLHIIALGQRRLAMDQYDEDRRSVVRELHKDLVLVSKDTLIKSAKQLPITNSHIEELDRAIKSRVKFSPPYPDFMRLDFEKQTEIVAALGEEWQRLAVVLQANRLSDWDRLLSADGVSLAHFPVGYLEWVIARRQDVASKAICKVFMEDPRKFRTKLDGLIKEAELGAAFMHQQVVKWQELNELLQAPPHGEAEHGGPEKMTDNDRELYDLLGDFQVKRGVLMAQPGETVPLSEVGQNLSKKDFCAIISKNLELLGRGFYRDLQPSNPRGVRLERWKAFDVGEKLCAKFHGQLRNITLTKIPVTHEELRKYFGGEYPLNVRPENSMRVAVGAELKSSGRSPIQAVIEVMLMIRQDVTHEQRDMITKSIRGAKSTAEMALESLRQEAVTIATTMDAWAAHRPLHGGAAEQGKNA